MRPIVGNTSSKGKKPTTPTIGTASAGNAQATVPFTESTYRGKSNSGTYRATSTPSSITGTCTAPCSSITVTGLSNGTAYTFTVQLETPYGVNSDLSASSNSVTPIAPPPSFAAPPSFPPSFPPDFPPNFPPSFPPDFPPNFPPNFPPQFVTCNGNCGSLDGYSLGPVVEAYDNPFGICSCCESTIYQQWDKAGCPSLACFMYCFECGLPYC